MKTSTALKIFRDYQNSNLKAGSVIGYRYLMDNFEELFGDKDLRSIGSEEVLHFLEIITEDNDKSTKRHRYAQLKAFFSFILLNYEPDLIKPIGQLLDEETFRLPKPKQRKITPKEIIDEVIFNSNTLRDRLLLELQWTCGACIGEALNIRVEDIDGRKIVVRNPKSGKEAEVIFMPE